MVRVSVVCMHATVKATFESSHDGPVLWPGSIPPKRAGYSDAQRHNYNIILKDEKAGWLQMGRPMQHILFGLG